MNDTKRCFLALPIPTRSQKQLETWRAQHLPPEMGRPVPAENFHLTLAFLGQCNHKQRQSLCKTIDQWANQQQPKGFELIFNRLGWFPKANVLWLAPTDFPAPFVTLATEIRAICHRQGLIQLDDYRPHVTLIRKAPAPSQILSPIRISVSCEQWGLYESISTQNGVEYQVLRSWPLTSAD